jgi:hypothetical protein
MAHTHVPERLNVSLNHVLYSADLTGYSRTTVPLLREQRDQSGEAGEESLNKEMWYRSQTDWSHGAGQEFLDNPDSDRLRFNTSSGVDPWTKGKVSLLPVTQEKSGSLTFTNTIMKIIGDYMYVAQGAALYYSSDFSNATPTWATVTAIGGDHTITDFDSDGTSVFVAYGSSSPVKKASVGATTVPGSFGSENPTYLKVVGGRLIFFENNVVKEIDASGAVATGALNYTIVHAGSGWVGAASGPTGVYLAANGAGTGSIYFSSIAAADGLLDTPQQVADLPRGEAINSILSYGGLLVLGTSKGLRLAVIDSQSGGVSFGPVVDNAGAVYGLAADKRFVWFGGGSGQVYRADLSVFTDVLVPAWASDVVSVGGSPGIVDWIGRHDGKTFFADSVNGVYGPEAAGVLVPSGTLTVGTIRWNSQFDKVLRSIEVRSEPTLAITGTVVYDSASKYDEEFYDGLASPVSGTVKVLLTPDTGTSLTELTMVNGVPQNPVYSLSSSYTLKITLERDAASTTAGPSLESWQVRAFPSPVRVDEIILPLLMFTRVATSRGQGAAHQQNPHSIYTELRSLMIAKSALLYEEGSHSEEVVVDQISVKPEQLSTDGDWWEGVITLRLLTMP